jgi:hypothetical protein
MATRTQSPGDDYGLATGEDRRAVRHRNANSPGARATAEWRRRRQQGIALVAVPVSADDVQLLVRTRWLATDEAHDRHAVGDAVSRLLDRVFEQLRRA